MFADIVPEQNFTVICSFDCSFEGGFGAMAALMVVLLVERVYGFRTNIVIPELGSRQLFGLHLGEIKSLVKTKQSLLKVEHNLLHNPEDFFLFFQ